ncbi:MAG: Uma2 family endonuclease [Chloroflexota bacterium]
MAEKVADDKRVEYQRLREELGLPDRLPDHTELPDSDGTIVKNFQEHPQSVLLTESIWPILEELHPDGNFAIGQDSGIYWRLTEPDEPAYRGAESPDWYYVPNVPPLLDGKLRRSYVMWQEHQRPHLVLEFVSGDGIEERDKTEKTGKFWVYEQVIRPGYYGIFFGFTGELEFYVLNGNGFKLMKPNKRKHFEIPDLSIEFGIWHGTYKNVKAPWLRIWDLEGNLIPTAQERAAQEAQRAEQEAQRAEQEAQRAEQEAQRAERLMDKNARMEAKFRELGIDPDEI